MVVSSQLQTPADLPPKYKSTAPNSRRLGGPEIRCEYFGENKKTDLDGNRSTIALSSGSLL
jgi:hypothetical protein